MQYNPLWQEWIRYFWWILCSAVVYKKHFFLCLDWGMAEVVFYRLGDAVAAVKRYNNVQLDGKPVKIEIVAPTVAPAANGTVCTI